MDSIEFTDLLSSRPNKWCLVTLKDGKTYEGINAGCYHDGFGNIMLRLENKAGNHVFGHTEVQRLDFKD